MIPDWILTEPAVVDKFTQAYLGRRYFRKKTGHYRSSNPHYQYLHRVVWQMCCGCIPAEHDIHHVDGNRSNNTLLNLQMLSHSEHASQSNKNRWADPEWRRHFLSKHQ